MATLFLLAFAILTVGFQQFLVEGRLSMDPSDLEMASKDYGGLKKVEPWAVLYPSSAHDIARLVKASYKSDRGFSVSARGHGHSINGQAMTADGFVVQMSGGSNGGGGGKSSTPVKPWVSKKLRYVDVWGGELWIDVLKYSLKYGLAPKSWVDYLYLSVGGTLSNAGFSGQAFNHGPQISNVHQLHVVTGKGKLIKCSRKRNSELFHAVLGGLGQFGIITRARIALEPAPQKVRWIRVIYSNFSDFTKDLEWLISLHGKPDSKKFNYVEGNVIIEERILKNWGSSFFTTTNSVKITSVNGAKGILYCLEITKNYRNSDMDDVDREVKVLLKKLNFIPDTLYSTDISYVEFLNRVHKVELKMRSIGLWEIPHPWLNLFVPKSKIDKFHRGVFNGILGNRSHGPILIYPVNRNKWDKRSSAVTPNEDVFYVVSFLNGAADNTTLKYLENQNHQILKFCDDAGINIKQYMPRYTTQKEWIKHYGDKWNIFLRRKHQFDPKNILATGQHIFQSALNRNFSLLKNNGDNHQIA